MKNNYNFWANVLMVAAVLTFYSCQDDMNDGLVEKDPISYLIFGH
jgi:hypothetical protein